MLDVGCGEGFAMAYFRRLGWVVQGCDFSSVGVQAMNPECMDVLNTGDVFQLLHERATAGQRYDLLWLNNVLEHVLDPLALMHQMRSLLADDGVLVVTVPNDFSDLQNHLIVRGHIPRPFWVALPDHLSYFDASSLEKVGDVTGYSCQRLLADFPIDWFLLHPGSNYVVNKAQGAAAHLARIQLENLLLAKPVEAVNDYYEAMARLGLGRQITAFFTPVLP